MYKRSLVVSVDKTEQQVDRHGTAAYPIALYKGNLAEGEVSWHWHEEVEIVTVPKGSIAVGVGQAAMVLNEGEGCFIRSGVIHNVWRVSDARCEYRSAVFHPRLIGSPDSIYYINCIRPLAERGFPRFIRIPKDSPIMELFRQLWLSETKEKPDHENEVRYLMTKIMSLLVKAPVAAAYRPTKKETRDTQRMKQMLEYVDSHFAEELTVSDIAASAGISESECLRCFRRSIGSSPVRYVKEYRLQRAAELVKETNLTISEVAEMCGFLDMSYFTSSFRKVYAMTPTEFRLKYAERNDEQ